MTAKPTELPPLDSLNVQRIINDAGFRMNAYAATYYHAMPKAERLYGADGLKSQIMYFLNNVRCSGELQKAAKATLKRMAK